MFNNFTISDLINIQKNQNLSQFSIDQIKPKVKNGILTGIKVHKINKNSTLVDSNLQNLLNKLFDSYCENHVIENYNDLMTNFGDNFAKEIMKKHIMYTTDMKATNKKDLKNISYLLEFEITSEDTSHLGDKFANRFAGKGVISLILPNELRPIAMATNKPIDCLYNSFGVFSRMNISQVLEGIIGKSVMNCEYNILSSNGSNIEKEISLLNENIIKYFNMNNYYNSIKELYSNHSNELYNDILKNGLFIEAPSFKKINIKEIIKNSNNIMEPMLIKKECLEYMEDLLKINLGFKLEDVILPNVFIGPIYMLKLHKISKVSMNVRDLGAHKFITKQPTKGKSIGGGLRFGDMEFRSIISHGCIKTIKELMTVKSDYVDGKEDLILQLVEKGEYNIGEIEKDISGTKKVVNTLIKFLND
jgi:DNA-directed RNA polymerase beta subunit